MKKIGIFFVGMLLVLSLVVPVWSQEVSLNPSYAQRNLSGTVRMHINIRGATDLLSTGVKVIFPADKLQVKSASKNTEVWKFEPLEPDSKAYLPEVEFDNTNGVVKMIGGRLSGVSGNVLLGWIVFQCIDTGEASVTVELANPPPYDNFVRANATVDDGSLDFKGATICIVLENACEGDFDGNSVVNVADKAVFRSALWAVFPDDPNYNSACDFNADGAINLADKAVFRTDLWRTDCPNCP